jgi:tetratricopeptide (TPR) repeat protein
LFSLRTSRIWIMLPLQIGALVEGSVQVVGDRLRVNVQLIDAATDEHLWAESYDRTLDDAFAIQSDIAQRIVTAVGAALGATGRRALAEPPTASAEAYRLYLQGLEYHGRAGYVRQNFESARQLYERAVALDPGFALAYAKLSEVYGLLHWFRYDPEASRVSQQREAAETALRLAPDLPHAHRAMGLAHYWGRRDYHAALEEFTLALDGLPNDAWLVTVTGYVHRRLGNWDAALAAFEEATHLDSRDATLFLDLGGITLQFVRRYADAVQAYAHALSLAPDYHEADARRAWTHVYRHGRLDSLRAALERIPPDADLGALGTRTTQLVHLLHWEREPDRLLQAVATTRQAVFERHLAFLPASLYAGWAHQLSGDSAAAREAFEAAIAVLDSVAEARPDDWRVNAGRGLVLAALGRRDEALREADRLARSAAYRDDAFFGPLIAEDRARIFAQAGEPEAALDEIERLIAEPSWLSVHALRLDPLWDPVRAQPRFRALVAWDGAEAGR